MKSLLFAALLLSISGLARAQEPIPRDEALKAAFHLCQDLQQLLDTPIPTDPDVKRAVGVHGDKRGLLVLPETRLASVDLAKTGSEPVAIGQLWMLRLVPLASEQPIKAEKLKTVSFKGEHSDAAATQCTLAVGKNGDGQPELLIFGKDKEPALRAALVKAAGEQDDPIEISAALQGGGAAVTLKIQGKYTASFSVGAAYLLW